MSVMRHITSTKSKDMYMPNIQQLYNIPARDSKTRSHIIAHISPRAAFSRKTLPWLAMISPSK